MAHRMPATRTPATSALKIALAANGAITSMSDQYDAIVAEMDKAMTDLGDQCKREIEPLANQVDEARALFDSVNGPATATRIAAEQDAHRAYELTISQAKDQLNHDLQAAQNQYSAQVNSAWTELNETSRIYNHKVKELNRRYEDEAKKWRKDLLQAEFNLARDMRRFGVPVKNYFSTKRPAVFRQPRIPPRDGQEK